jgi:glycosyltransferase involved in cell wall biosynthesis
MEPLTSICIPAYNAEQFIAETLDSALAQTYPHIEIVVSDDASTDRTVEIVSSYGEQGVRLIKQARNVGRYGNCNAVILASSGRYVLKLDADDLVAPDHVAEQVRVLESHPEVVFAHCACRLIDENGCLLGYERSIHGSFIRDGLDEWPRYVFGPRAVNIVVLRRSAYNQVGGYNAEYKYSGDWAMHRALLRIGSVFYNDHVLASYRVHDVGKQGIRRLQAREHLVHLEEMEQHWPAQVPNKTKLLSNARKYWAFHALLAAAHCEKQERQDILQLVPHYTDSWEVRLLLGVMYHGGAGLVRLYTLGKNRLRLLAKALIFAIRQDQNAEAM